MSGEELLFFVSMVLGLILLVLGLIGRKRIKIFSYIATTNKHKVAMTECCGVQALTTNDLGKYCMLWSYCCPKCGKRDTNIRMRAPGVEGYKIPVIV